MSYSTHRLPSRRVVLSGAAAGTAAVLLGSMPAEAKGRGHVTLVRDGVARAVVTVANDSDDRVGASADRLIEHVRQATGVTLRRGEVTPRDIEVRIGEPVPDALADDGFEISIGPRLITIAGPTSWGTQFGVDEFLERYVGVRWLLPGNDGVDVPQMNTLSVPCEAHRDEPAAISRRTTGLSVGSMSEPVRQARLEWGLRNRMHDHVSFIHNLYRVLPPAKYYDEHPEWYPGGERPSGNSGWQPCFTAEGTVQAAVNEIVAHLDANPEQTTFSLGINDGTNYCEADPDHPAYPGRTNSIGAVHMSEIYFDWANQVIEGVLESHPDVWFGMLAYRNTYDPPAFNVHPRAIVYMTDDRMAWAHPDEEAAGHTRTEGWAAVAENIAFYEYSYGMTYGIPRVYMHRMADTYRYAADQGVMAHAAESYPGFGEGPKSWLAMRLQWDPYADVDLLLDEWYERAVGAAAAPFLRQYYAHWEQYWTDRILDSDWFAERLRPRHLDYLRHTSRRYLEPVTDDDLTQSRYWLEKAVENSNTPPQQARANLMLRAFEYHEAAGRAFGEGVESPEAPTTPTAALSLVSAVERRYAAHTRLFELVEEFASDPVLVHPGNPSVYFGTPPAVADTTSSGTGRYTATTALAGLVAWLSNNDSDGEPARTRLQELAQATTESPLRNYARLALAAAGGTPSLLVNGGFEDGIAGWTVDAGTPQGVTDVVAEASRRGSAGLRATGFAGGSVSQTVPVGAGAHGVVAYFRGQEPATAGTVAFRVTLRSADDQTLRTLTGPTYHVKSRPGAWASAETLVNIPGQVGGTAIAKATVSVLLGGPGEWNAFPSEAYVDLDDIGLYALDS